MKKGLHIFLCIIFGIVALWLLKVIVSPRQYDWKISFDAQSDEPFGMLFVDSLIRHSLPNGWYDTSDTATWTHTFRHAIRQVHSAQGEEKEDSILRNILIVGNKINYIDDTAEKALLDYLLRGGHVMIAAIQTPASLFSDARHPSPGQKEESEENALSYTPYCSGYINEQILKNDIEYDARLEVFVPSSEKGAKVYTISGIHGYSSISQTYSGSNDNILAQTPPQSTSDEWGNTYNSPDVYAQAFTIGKGRLILVSMPLLFTNYGMLHDEDACPLLFRLLSTISDRPILRIEAPTNKKEHSLLRYINSQPPLRTAFWATIVVILLLMLTTARRRQRVIPVMRAPQNHTLEFVRLIGTLYFNQHAGDDLVKKKYVFTNDWMRRKLHVDLNDRDNDRQTMAVIARATRRSQQEVTDDVEKIRRFMAHPFPLTDRQTEQYIDLLNRLTENYGK